MFNVTLAATSIAQLASRFADTGPGGWRITFDFTGTGSCVLKQNLNPPGTNPTAANMTDVAYYDSNGALVAAGTAITTDSYVTVDAVNADLWVAYTRTNGQVFITRQISPTVGAEPGEGFLPADNPAFTGALTGPSATIPAITGTLTGAASLNVLTATNNADRVLSATGLVRGSTDTSVANIAFTYQVGAALGSVNTYFAKAAVTAGTALAAGAIPANKWGLYVMSIIAGTITMTPAAANFTTGYNSEALAKAALVATPAGAAAMGYFTVLTASGQPFIGNTDALAGGSSGNPATTTNYYDAGLGYV